MTAELQRRPLGRPRDAAKTEAILDAAWALFLDRGFNAVPVEAVAARAGVSKGTLYAAFPDKPALFRAAMLREMERIEAAQGIEARRAADVPLAEQLRAFGTGIMTYLASGPAVGFYSALSSELRRHPELALAFWELGPGRTRANLATILAAAANRGELAINDPVHAAEALFGLWQGFSNLQYALDIGRDETRAAIAGRVERGITIFLRAHQTDGDALE